MGSGQRWFKNCQCVASLGMAATVSLPSLLSSTQPALILGICKVSSPGWVLRKPGDLRQHFWGQHTSLLSFPRDFGIPVTTKKPSKIKKVANHLWAQVIAGDSSGYGCEVFPNPHSAPRPCLTFAHGWGFSQSFCISLVWVGQKTPVGGFRCTKSGLVVSLDWFCLGRLPSQAETPHGCLWVSWVPSGRDWGDKGVEISLGRGRGICIEA